MASPLSPAQGSALNAARQRRYDEYEVYKYTTMTNTHHGGGSSSSSSKLQYQQNTGDYNNNNDNNNNDDGHDDEDPPSSPLISHTSTMPVPEEQENNTQGQQQQQQQQQYYHQQSQRSNALQSRRRHSRVISGTELSPLKILSRKRASEGDDGDGYDNKLQEQHNEDENRGRMGPPPARNPRRLSPVRRFPVKVSGGEETHRATAAAAAGMMQQERRDNGYSMGDALRKNQGLKQAIEVFEDGDSSMEEEQEEDCGGGQVNKEAPAAATTENADASAEEAAPGADDTMASTFSTFSAVPNMAMLAKLGHSPFKGQQPRAGSPLKTSRPSTRDESGGNTTNLLMDFTDQLRYPHKSSPEKRGNLPGSVTTPNLGDAGQNATPSRRLTNLIDFDIPPQPTPRSVPSVTPRELESLKSDFLSQISSLKASLSGKEAEVQSLKTAVGDAEKRAGETMEQLREESALKEQVSAEKEDWEKRGLEMEKMLRQVKEDVELSQTEREDLERKLEESEKRREAAEIMHQEAESKIAGLRAGRDGGSSSGSGVDKSASSPGQTNKEVEIAVERVARELHTLYKSKHETKVTALKKSYEARWEKKVKELEKRVAELSEQNNTLQRAADKQASRTTETGSAAAGMEARKQQAAKDSARIQELNAGIQRLEAVVTSVQKDNSDMREMLEKERVEKGELVQLAEEMMSMQSFVGGSAATQRAAAAAAAARSESEMTKTPKASAESRRASMGRASGIRAPGSALRGQSRTSVGGAGGGVSRFGAPTPRRSGILSSIEKMGSHRGRGQQE